MLIRRLAAVLLLSAAGALAGGVAGNAHNPGGPASPSARPEPQSILLRCPDLHPGGIDPVNGRACIRVLQTALHDSGYSAQPVTGRYLAQTTANVRDYQHTHGINPASGIAGPQTRAALAGGTSTRFVLPRFSPHSGCGSSACRLYLTRSTTYRYSQWITDHPASTGFLSTIVVKGTCVALRLHHASGFICEFLGEDTLSRITAQTQNAARHGACLRLTLALPTRHNDLRLLDTGTDQSSHCTS